MLSPAPILKVAVMRITYTFPPTCDRKRRIFTTVENENGSSMPAFSRVTVLSGPACLFRWGQSAARSRSTAACQTQRVLQKQLPSISAINRAGSFKTTTGVTSKLGSGLFVPVSRNSSMSSSMSQRMVWVDLEMTGLDIEKDQIIEMACLITDSDLNILAEGPNLIINQPDELLDGMSEWCKEHHGKSGLTQAVRNSKITLEQAEYEFLSFVRQHTPPGQCPLAGNSVHADKRFLEKYMPQFMYHLHYRIIDVSTVKELCRRWFPEEYKRVPHKKATHRALSDIYESIKELQFYKSSIFKVSAEAPLSKIVENGGSNNC